MSEIIGAIKSKLNLADLVRDSGVELQTKSNGTHTACCPFHTEKTPSFMVDDSRQTFKCWGCDESGDAISFYAKFNNVENKDAILYFIELFDLNLQLDQGFNLFKVYTKLQNLYSENLLGDNSVSGKMARKYLTCRQLDAASERFGLGFAPASWSQLYRYLRSEYKYITNEAWHKASLLGKSDQGKYYDFLRSRLIFPVRKSNGEVVGFLGRALTDEKPKYLIASTDDYPRNDWVYGYYEARQAKLPTHTCVVSEGATDVIAWQMAGVFSVSSLGTSVSPKLIKFLSKRFYSIAFCFDGDLAGDKAIYKLLSLVMPLLSTRKEIKIIKMPESFDPDLIRLKEGDGALLKYLEKSVPLVDYLATLAMSFDVIDKPHEKISFIDSILALFKLIPDVTVRDIYAQSIEKATGLPLTSYLFHPK